MDGVRPSARRRAATETIDRSRGLIHGGYDREKYFSDSFVIDLRAKVPYSLIIKTLESNCECYRHGFLSLLRQIPPIDRITDFVDYQKRD